MSWVSTRKAPSMGLARHPLPGPVEGECDWPVWRSPRNVSPSPSHVPLCSFIAAIPIVSQLSCIWVCTAKGMENGAFERQGRAQLDRNPIFLLSVRTTIANSNLPEDTAWVCAVQWQALHHSLRCSSGRNQSVPVLWLKQLFLDHELLTTGGSLYPIRLPFGFCMPEVLPNSN